ncbi:VWA domain-containing protein [Aeoliella sp. ICT_H6.2]|uniref:VWA domain-containing protein n=1 Tax=Aeoliella straminimaris TaxID=2954799 RepID=A0A9X2JH88_9BACT|nr:FixH family protein [Aeoliella straminimaris]MCO6045536.1 VWA domain-containing protein [Aeoliella straminimaris]
MSTEHQTIDFALELLRPHMLWVLLLLVPVGWYFHRSLSDFPWPQRLASLVLRSLIVLLLVLALSGLVLLKPTSTMYVVFGIDRSLSVDEAASEQIDELVEQVAQTAGENRVAYMDFASEASALKETSDGAAIADDEARRGTNLAHAIEMATAAIPPGYVPQVVLLTDGRETSGDAVQAAAVSSSPISVMPLPVRDDPEVQVAEVVAPAEVRQGEPFYVEVVISSNHEDEGYIDVYRGDLLANEQSEPVKIKVGETRFRFRQSIDNESQTDYAVRLRDFDDSLVDNNSASAVVFASGKPSVLVVDASVNESNHFRWALEEQDISVQVRPAEAIPRSLAELQKFDCLVLSNIPATKMTMHQMEIIRTYVEDLGGGLVMIGGDQSFGLGGYYKTALEEILPVRSNFEKEKEKPSLAMVLVIDKSGSMGGEKIELAKDAAKGAAELLGPKDQLGVIAFDGASYWVSEIHSAADKGYIIDRISTIEASGGTSIYPALADAYDGLIGTTAKLKHVILLTDGHSGPGDFEGIANDMVAARITLSGVAVGGAADQQLLETLAQTGGGRFYLCDDPASVPQIFAKETVEASKSAINELPFVPLLVRPTQVLSGIDLEAAPFLLGYVITRPKPTSEFILSSEAGDPVLVWWRYGLGVTVAFTSDAKSQWAAEWLTWPDFSRFWSQVIRHAMRKSDAKGVFVEVERSGDQARVVVDSVDVAGRFIHAADTKMTLIRPNLDKEDVTLEQTAPGRYETKFTADDRGAYHLELSQQQNGQVTFRQTRGVVVGYPDELRLGIPNETLMHRIAEVSGGRYSPKVEEIFDPDDRLARQVVRLWPYLLGAALVLFVFDVALKRLDLAPLFRNAV